MSEKNYGKGWDNIDDAAAAALMLLAHQPRVDNQEYMGLLVKGADGKYYRTALQTQGKRTASEWRGYPDGRLAGIVHNHPVEDEDNSHGYGPQVFSDTDVNMARENNVPSYIAKMVAGGLPVESRYTPGVSGTFRAPGPGKRPVELAIGDQFLAEFPWEEFKQHMMRQILERAPNDPRGLMR
jgi:hypothetical protein